MSILVIADHNQGVLSVGVRSVVTAAGAFKSNITVLVMGKNVQNVARDAAMIAGVHDVLYADHDGFESMMAEPMAAYIAGIATGYTHILAPASTFGKNLLPRVAALLDVMQLSDVCQIVDDHTFVRPIYAGNAFETVRSSDTICVITARTTTFDRAPLVATPAPIHEQAVQLGDYPVVQLMERSVRTADRPDLTSARIVVSGGRGLQSGEHFKIIESLADTLGAAIGASRAAVDAGFVPNDYQVGQTGKIVAPDLYIAIGISGAIQHLAGMKDSKIIVAINKDPDAPIFAIADYGLVGDLFDIVPELNARLRALKAAS